ncbi:MAG TPA: IPT/TIG domain-containing protein [Polyangia bacterium]|nr:IPT/TIG domain-containing protein [Polyangia bacterium]
MWPAPVALAIAVAVAPALGGTVSCGAGEQLPELYKIDPVSSYNDAAVPVQVSGTHFRPPLDIDTHSGTAGVGKPPFQIFVIPADETSPGEVVEALDEKWLTDERIDAALPAGLPTGDYRVGLRDRRGNQVTSQVLFTSLGPDNDPPRITFMQPSAGTTVAPESWVMVVAKVIDDPGQVTRDGQWCARSPSLGCTPGVCKLDLDDTCRFLFMAPSKPNPIEKIQVELEIRDSVLNAATATLPLQVAWRPEIVSLTPSVGPTSGGTEITVQGNQLIEGLSRVLVDGRPIGGRTESDTIIRAVTQSHPPGVALVTLGNGDSPSAPRPFKFVAAPIIKVVDPRHAPAGENARITVAGDYFSTETRFSWVQDGLEHPIPPGDKDAPSPPPNAVYQTEHRYVITLAPGSGVISLRAHDDVGGDSELTDAFTFDPAP